MKRLTLGANDKKPLVVCNMFVKKDYKLVISYHFADFRGPILQANPTRWSGTICSRLGQNLEMTSWPDGSIWATKKSPGWLGCIGDEKLPRYIGIIINHYKDPY